MKIEYKDGETRFWVDEHIATHLGHSVSVNWTSAEGEDFAVDGWLKQPFDDERGFLQVVVAEAIDDWEREGSLHVIDTSDDAVWESLNIEVY